MNPSLEQFCVIYKEPLTTAFKCSHMLLKSSVRLGEFPDNQNVTELVFLIFISSPASVNSDCNYSFICSWMILLYQTKSALATILMENKETVLRERMRTMLCRAKIKHTQLLYTDYKSCFLKP